MTEIVSRQDAIKLGRARYFTGKPCKQGHVDERLVSTSSCRGCNREYGRKWCEEDPERALAKARRERTKNPEKTLEVAVMFHVYGISPPPTRLSA